MHDDQKIGPGGHYSGGNPVPNIQNFVESLDKDKKARDAKINERMGQGSDVQPHKPGRSVGVPSTRKKVTDPVTGREVEIEDVNADFMKAVDDPKVSFPRNGPSLITKLCLLDFGTERKCRQGDNCQSRGNAIWRRVSS